MSVSIDKIEFKNYRQYGTGTIHFSTPGEYNLSVLIAKNGTGKTTLLNAITWCLYGKEPHLADESRALPIVNNDVLRKAQVDDTVTVSVAVTITDKTDTIEFRRKMNYKIVGNGEDRNVICGYSEITATTTSDNFVNTTVKQGADAELVIKQYFDESIYKFYFFDGEQLSDYFSAAQASLIKQSIFNISQVTLLNRACDHLEKIKREKKRKAGENSPDIEALNLERNKLEESLQTAKRTLEDNIQQLDEHQKAKLQLDRQYHTYEPVRKLQNERAEIENALISIEEEKKRFLARKSAFIREYTILLNLYPRIQHTYKLICAKEEKGELPPAIDKNQVKRLLEHVDEACPLCNGTIGENGRHHLEWLLDRISVSNETSNYLKEIKGSLEVFIEKAKSFKHNYEEIRQNDIDISRREKEKTERLKEISSMLSNFDSENDQVNVAKLEQKRTDVSNKIRHATETIGSVKKSISDLEKDIAEIDKNISEALKRNTELISLRHQIEVIDELYYQISRICGNIMSEMKTEIEETTWSIFDSMIWKRNTFGSVKISDSYNIAVYNQNGTEMTGSLSATEQMALAYAFTLSIHKASGQNCPLVIDSPLGRVSDENRSKMAQVLLDISKNKQIIMLFTPDEYSEGVSSLYDNNAKVMTLTLSEDEKFIEGIDK